MIKTDKDLKKFIESNKNNLPLVFHNIMPKTKAKFIEGKAISIALYNTDTFSVISHEKHVTRLI